MTNKKERVLLERVCPCGVAFTTYNSLKLYHATTCQKRVNMYNQNSRAARKDKGKAYKYISRYGISEGEILAQRELQGQACPLCGNVGNLVTDHDHVTGKIRGQICRWCNAGLGSFRDNPQALILAAQYLEHSREH